MSKLSQLHAELSEQAYKLGFESLDQAIESGEYEVISNGNWAELVPTKDEQNKAYEAWHEAWLKEQQIVLGDLMNLMIHKVYDHDSIERAYKFIKEQCHD